MVAVSMRVFCWWCCHWLWCGTEACRVWDAAHAVPLMFCWACCYPLLIDDNCLNECLNVVSILGCIHTEKDCWSGPTVWSGFGPEPCVWSVLRLPSTGHFCSKPMFANKTMWLSISLIIWEEFWGWVKAKRQNKGNVFAILLGIVHLKRITLYFTDELQ